MIRTANSAIVIADLESRVRTEIARLPASHIAATSGIDDLAWAQRIRYVRELLVDIDARLANATERSAARSAVPPRLAKLGPLGPALLRALNYAFKSQRESDAELRAAVRGTTAALAALTDLIEARK